MSLFKCRSWALRLDGPEFRYGLLSLISDWLLTQSAGPPCRSAQVNIIAISKNTEQVEMSVLRTFSLLTRFDRLSGACGDYARPESHMLNYPPLLIVSFRSRLGILTSVSLT
jgi:hypothetical protein